MYYDDPVLKNYFYEFLDLLYSSNYNNIPNLRGIFLEKSSFVKVHDCFYRDKINFCSFLNYFCDFYNVSFESVSILLKQFVDFDSYRNVVIRNKVGKIDYEKYISKINNNEKFDFEDNAFKCVRAEHIVYNDELKSIEFFCKKYNISPNFFVHWISKDFGDGYGYDIGGFDFLKNKEKLIEVKGTVDSELYGSLTNNELLKLEDLVRKGYDYFVYVVLFFFHSHNCRKLKYDLENDCFCDINSNEIFLIDRDHIVIESAKDYPIVTEKRYKSKKKKLGLI